MKRKIPRRRKQGKRARGKLSVGIACYKAGDKVEIRYNGLCEVYEFDGVKFRLATHPIVSVERVCIEGKEVPIRYVVAENINLSAPEDEVRRSIERALKPPTPPRQQPPRTQPTSLPASSGSKKSRP
jgi:hypothetical protein